MFLRLSAALFVFVMWTGATFTADEVEFSQHLIGCWQHGAIPPATGKPEEVLMTHTCFEGGTEGKAVTSTCHGFGTFDCWESTERYALAGSKLHLVSGDVDEEVCDAQVVPEKTLRLYNCDGDEASSTERIYVRVDRP